jgi:hypothetical protein
MESQDNLNVQLKASPVEVEVEVEDWRLAYLARYLR